MRRIVSAFLSLCILLSFSSGYAAGKITIEKENFSFIESNRSYGYAYAKVANIGNKAIKVNAGILEVFDTEGDNITSTDRLYSYAEYLQPDEYTYVKMYAEIPKEQAISVDDYLLTLTGKSDTSYVSTRLSVSDSRYAVENSSAYSTYHYMYATITNNTEDIIWHLNLVMALLDDDDNILYMDSSYLSSEIGLMPGNTIIARLSVSSSFIDYFEKNSITPTHVDTIAYINKKAN